MKSKSLRNLRIITVLYTALYLTMIVTTLYKGELSFHKIIDILFLFLFVLFLSGIAFLWRKERVAGIIFMVWNAGIWMFDLGPGRGNDSGMLSIMAVPLMVIGAFLYLEWYKTFWKPQPSVASRWKFILRVLLINYSVLYTIVVISEQFSDRIYDYFSLPFILLPILFLVFIIGFAFSWKWEYQSGFIFIFWYAILFTSSVVYSEFLDSGPWLLFGVPILLQGLIYIKNYHLFKTG